MLCGAGLEIYVELGSSCFPFVIQIIQWGVEDQGVELNFRKEMKHQNTLKYH